jgi:tol-pal system protein YbgF
MRSLVIPAALALASVGCVSTGDMELLHREITDVSRQVENLSRQSSGKEDLQAMSGKLAEQNAQVLKSNADIQVEIEQLRDQIETLRATLDATNQRLESVSNELAATRQQLPAQTTAPMPPGESADQAAPGEASSGPAPGAAQPVAAEPTQLYSGAYQDYLRGNYDLAIQGFQEYRKRFPATDLADNALYWIGECYYSKRQFKEAIDAFTELLNTYKDSDKAAAALLKKGLAYLELGDRAQAVINLQYVLYEHPGTKEADLARERLAGLGVKIR